MGLGVAWRLRVSLARHASIEYAGSMLRQGETGLGGCGVTSSRPCAAVALLPSLPREALVLETWRSFVPLLAAPGGGALRRLSHWRSAGDARSLHFSPGSGNASVRCIGGASPLCTAWYGRTAFFPLVIFVLR